MIEVKAAAARAVKAWRESKPLIAATALVCFGAVVALDSWSGPDFSLQIFYLPPIILLAWFLRRRWAFLLSLAATYFTYSLNLTHRGYRRPSTAFWDALTYEAFYVLAILGTEKLARLTGRTRRLLQMKTDMLSLVSHELGNNLAVMTSVLFLLKETDGEGRAGEAKRQKLFEMLERVYRMMRLTCETFLDQVRMESGTFVLTKRRVDLRGLAQNSVAVLSTLARHKGVDLREVYPPSAVLVDVDPDALALVFSNIVGNAVKYTAQGGVVTVRIGLSAPRGGVASVTIEDTGIGIAKRDQEAVFSGFYRTRESQRVAKGTGVGLKVSRDLLERHGFLLQLDSVPGKGSRFFFDVPVAPDDAPATRAS